MTKYLVHIIGLTFFLQILIGYVQLKGIAIPIWCLLFAVTISCLILVMHKSLFVSYRLNMLIVYIILLALSIILSSMVAHIPFGIIMRTTIVKIIAAIFLIIVCVQGIKSTKSLQIVIQYTLAAIVISTLFAYFQFLGYDFASTVKSYLYSYSVLPEDLLKTGITSKRVSGLSHTIHNFGYILSIGVVYPIVSLANSRGNVFTKAFNLFLLLLFIGAMYLSGNRAAILASLVVLLLAFRPSINHLTKRLKTLLMVISTVSIALFFFKGVILSEDTAYHSSRLQKMINIKEMGHDPRISTWIAGSYAGLSRFPFGCGREYQETLLSLHGSLPSFIDTDYAFKYTPHNQFINVWAKFGLLPLVFIILIYKNTIISMLSVKPINIPYHLVYFVKYAIFAYIINSLFHNAGLQNTITGWLLIGLGAAAYQINITGSQMSGCVAKETMNVQR